MRRHPLRTGEHAGDEEFWKRMDTVEIKWGKKEEGNFTFCGVTFKDKGNSITMDQLDYIQMIQKLLILL